MCLIAVSTDLGGIVRTRSTVNAPTPRRWELKASVGICWIWNSGLTCSTWSSPKTSCCSTSLNTWISDQWPPRPEPVETPQARGFDLSSVERTHDAARRDGGEPADAVIFRLPPGHEGLNSTHLRLQTAQMRQERTFTCRRRADLQSLAPNVRSRGHGAAPRPLLRASKSPAVFIISDQRARRLETGSSSSIDDVGTARL